MRCLWYNVRMWMRGTTFMLFAVALSVLGVAHTAASAFYLYWTYSWLDMPMHALGGAAVALGFLAFCTGCARAPFPRGLLATLVAVLIAGIAWEIFEVAAHVTLPEVGQARDTAQDVIADLIGGSAGYWAARAAAAFDAARKSV